MFHFQVQVYFFKERKTERISAISNCITVYQLKGSYNEMCMYNLQREYCNNEEFYL